VSLLGLHRITMELRVDSQLTIRTSVGADVYKSDRLNMRFHADRDNLNDRLNIIDFGGLFSGNAIGSARSFNLRLTSISLGNPRTPALKDKNCATPLRAPGIPLRSG
jgi:hypothetical protein